MKHELFIISLIKDSKSEMAARVYLDYNATTPTDPQVVDALVPYLSEAFGNASSSYPLGVEAKRAVENARAQVARMLGGATDEILFLSGGTESINYALKGSAQVAKQLSGRNHIITSVAEHVAVLETCRHLETQGFQVTYLDVDQYGRTSVQGNRYCTLTARPVLDRLIVC